MAFYRRGGISLFGLIYLIIGVIVAWNRGYLDTDLLRKILSAVLAVLLWFLVLLGANLHIHP